RLDDATNLVRATTLKNYPSLNVPFHSRWRHFFYHGEDRWGAIANTKAWRDVAQRARAEFDLAIISVLLDAGAGPGWRYRDSATGTSIGWSEGLALASLEMFVLGIFSSNPDEPLRADADALQRLSAEKLRAGFQTSDDNPLIGIEGRAALLRSLGNAIAVT